MLRTTVAAVFLSLLSQAAAQNSTQCYSGLYMVVARASTEKPGVGIIGNVSTQVSQAIPNSYAVPVVYPATLTDYMSSEEQGVVGMTSLIKEYVDACPGSKVALLGYSQGAQVTADTLCGASEQSFNKTAPLSGKYADAIIAAVLMGDPTFVPGQSYDAGNSTTSGDFNRTDPSACQPFASRMKSYCDEGDLYCAKGTSIVIHVSYVIKYGKQAAAFIEDQFRSANATSSVSPSSTSAAPTSSNTSPSASNTAGTGDSNTNAAPSNLTPITGSLFVTLALAFSLLSGVFLS